LKIILNFSLYKIFVQCHDVLKVRSEVLINDNLHSIPSNIIEIQKDMFFLFLTISGKKAGKVNFSSGNDVFFCHVIKLKYHTNFITLEKKRVFCSYQKKTWAPSNVDFESYQKPYFFSIITKIILKISIVIPNNPLESPNTVLFSKLT